MSYNYSRHNSVGGNWSASNYAQPPQPPAQRAPPYPPQQQHQPPQQEASPGFRNPWFNPNQLGSQSNLPPQQPHSPTRHTHLLQQTPPRLSFANQLPTTYEYDQQRQSQNPQSFLPPSRVDNPFPFYNNQEVLLNQNIPNRRSSIAVTNYNLNHNGHIQQHPQQQQFDQHQQQIPYPYSTHLPPPPMITPKAFEIKSKSDLKPMINQNPKYRRASSNSAHISPLVALTLSLPSTYHICQPSFDYKYTSNPKRVLTKPSEPKYNNGFDNEDSDYILYVNDILGTQESKRYIVLDILGKGTFGQVVKCQNLVNQEIVAIKVIKSKPAFLSQSLTEVSLLEYINDKSNCNNEDNFIKLFDKFIHKEHLCLVFELLSSNLYELIKQNNFSGLPLRLVKSFSKQLLSGLIKLKDNSIIHCDLKPENILLIQHDQPPIKIIDFGSACYERQTIYTYIQSRFYRSPEVILGLPYSSSIDMWSLGCIVGELFLGLPLFPGTSEFNQISRIIKMTKYPPTYMLDMGKNSLNFFKKIENYDTSTNRPKFQLKTPKEYLADFPDNIDKPNKDYFDHEKLRDIILNYKYPPKKMTPLMLEKELNERLSLMNFLEGILNLNPLERWTPQQAILHPFVNDGIEFKGDWKPPGPDNINGSFGTNSNGSNDKSTHGSGAGFGSGSGSGVGAKRGQNKSNNNLNNNNLNNTLGNINKANFNTANLQYLKESKTPLSKVVLKKKSSSNFLEKFDSPLINSTPNSNSSVNSSTSSLSFHSINNFSGNFDSSNNGNFTSVKSIID